MKMYSKEHPEGVDILPSKIAHMKRIGYSEKPILKKPNQDKK